MLRRFLLPVFVVGLLVSFSGSSQAQGLPFTPSQLEALIFIDGLGLISVEADPNPPFFRVVCDEEFEAVADQLADLILMKDFDRTELVDQFTDPSTTPDQRKALEMQIAEMDECLKTFIQFMSYFNIVRGLCS